MYDCYREKKDNRQPLESGHHGSSAITAEKQNESLPQKPRLPCSNCRKMGSKCRAAGNDPEKRCQQCIDRGFISCENSLLLLSGIGPSLKLELPHHSRMSLPATSGSGSAGTTSESGTTSKDDSAVVSGSGIGKPCGRGRNFYNPACDVCARK
jgi:hypothetical protein